MNTQEPKKDKPHADKAMDLEILSPRAITPRDVALIDKLALNARKSRVLQLATAEEAALRMQIAMEHGFPATAGLSVVHIVDKTPSLAPKAVWAKIINHPDFEEYSEEELFYPDGSFLGFRIGMKRRKFPKMIYRQFTLEDAKRIVVNSTGKTLYEKMNYQNYGSQMCQWRALGFLIDILFPDVGLGLLRATDLGAVIDEDWNVVDSTWSEVVEAVADNETLTPFDLELQGILETYSVDEILSMNDGKMPQSVHELSAVRVKLEGKDG